MGKTKDLTGLVFGNLTVVRLAVKGIEHTGTKIKWWCNCLCGNCIMVSSTHLISGHTKACRHCRIPPNYVSLVGQSFGSLVPQNYIKNEAKYECLCDCGKLIKITSVNLKSGNTKSCGCKSKVLLREAAVAKYKNKTVNGISFIKPVSSLDCSGHIVWELKCVCGKIFERPAVLIISGHTKSCGCISNNLRSKALGGTGIPYENSTVYEMIRSSPEYTSWRDVCLQKAYYKCELTNNKSHDVQVHHIIPLNMLVATYNITKDNINEFSDILYNTSNGIVMTTEIHREFHYLYGNDTNYKMLKEYKEILQMENI